MEDCFCTGGNQSAAVYNWTEAGQIRRPFTGSCTDVENYRNQLLVNGQVRESSECPQKGELVITFILFIIDQ